MDSLYFLDSALTVEKSSEIYLHFCLNLCVFGSSLRFDQDLASMVLSTMECILLIRLKLQIQDSELLQL